MTSVLLLVLVGVCALIGGADVLDRGRRARATRPVISDPTRIRAAVRAAALGHIPDGHFDGVCDRIRQAYDVPAAFVSLLDDRNQILKGMSGLEERDRVLPLDFSVCQFVVASGRPVEFPDTAVAPELAVCEISSDIGAYFGEPLCFEGQRVGAVGLIDHRPRPDLVGTVHLQPFVDEVAGELDRRARIRT